MQATSLQILALNYNLEGGVSSCSLSIHAYNREPMKDISKKIKPLEDRVLIRKEEESKEKKTASGIIIPATVTEDNNTKIGEIVAMGPGRISNDGKMVKTSLKVGDKVLFQWGEKIRIEDVEYYVVRESEIFAIIK
jgi:chaperonin GroES